MQAVIYAGLRNGARFRSDRPSYQQMLDYSEMQFDMFADFNEPIECFCGD